MTRPHPDRWYPMAQLLAALRQLLRATAPETFAAIALDARAHLAAELVLPPRAKPPLTDHPAERAGAPKGRRDYRFPLIEKPSKPSQSASGEDPPELQWALLVQAAQRLAEVMANPAPHARRLARRFGTLLVPGLRDLAVPWHIIRRIGPALDILLMRLDQRARPQAWAGLDTS